jgi:hypothetical protein
VPKVVTTGAQSGKVQLVRHTAPDATAHRVQYSDWPGPFIDVAFVGVFGGLRHRDRIAASNRSWIRCLRRARVATRRGQSVDRLQASQDLQ